MNPDLLRDCLSKNLYICRLRISSYLCTCIKTNMTMRKLFLLTLASMLAISGFAQSPKIYFTKDITPESLVKIYEALGVTPKEGQRVAVKISTGESSQSNHLRLSSSRIWCRRWAATSWSATRRTAATAQQRRTIKRLSNSVDSERLPPLTSWTRKAPSTCPSPTQNT